MCSRAVKWLDSGSSWRNSRRIYENVYAWLLHRRGCLCVSLDGVAIRPALALTSWIAFAPASGGKTMVMGEVVTTENHLFGETPKG